MHGYRLIGALLALLAGGCLLLTGWIMHISGALQGVTENGRWALGLAAIAVHLILAVCGLAMFVSRNLFVSAVCGVMMLGAAACSAWQIATFLATEVISITKAREQADKRETARNAALIEMAKDRQKTQADLAKGHLKWVEGTIRSADGRRDRKDSMEAGLKVIAEMGKIEAPALPEAKSEPPRFQSGQVAAWLAAKFGYDETTMQASPYLMIALMLLLIEVVGWPLSSYFWSRAKQLAPEIGSAPSSGPEPAPPILSPAVQPAALAASMVPKALPAPTVALQSADVGQPDPEPPPRPVHPSKAPAPVQRPRQPISPEAVQALKEVAFPLVRPAGGLRAKELPKDAARRFLVWAKAMGLDGEYGATELATLYREFSEADHREPVPYNQLAGVLGNARGIDKTRPAGSTTSVWVITPGRFKAKAAKEPEGERLGHLTPSKQAEAIADAAPVEAGARRPFSSGAAPVVVRLVPMPPSQGEPAWLHENRKRMRRWRLAQNHKQRGPRRAA